MSAADPRAAHYPRLIAELEVAEAALDEVNVQRGARVAALARAEMVLQPILEWGKNFEFHAVGLAIDLVDIDTRAEALALRHKGETWIEAVDRLRGELREREHAIATLRSAPQPVSDVITMITREIAAKAQIGRPRLMVNGPRIGIAWPDAAGGFGPGLPNGIVSAMICALAGSTIEAALIEDATAMIGDHGLPLAGRDTQIAGLESEVRQLRSEAEIVRQAAAMDGIEIAQDAGTDVPAMLQIRRASAPIAVAAE